MNPTRASRTFSSIEAMLRMTSNIGTKCSDLGQYLGTEM